jgi:hypothetical protein
LLLYMSAGGRDEGEIGISLRYFPVVNGFIFDIST